MKYLVTGGTGFLGKYIVDFLIQSGNNVFVTTRNPTNKQHIFANFEKGILEIESSPLFNNDASEYIVIHAAGKAHSYPKTEQERKAFFDVNVEGTRMLLDKLERLPLLPKAIVFISSVAVYGKEKGLDIKESELSGAIDPYGKSKIEAENLIIAWGTKHNIDTGILRLPLVVGNHPPGNLGTMVKGIKSGRYFRIGKGSARKSMVWAADVAGILPILSQRGGVYTLTDGYNPTFAELEDEITKLLHKKPVKKMPLAFIVFAGTIGSILEAVFRKKMPITKNIVTKIISPLTFSDQKARVELNWSPTPVLNHIKEMLQ